MRIIGFKALIAAAVIGLSACGTDDAKGGTNTDAATADVKYEYVKIADAKATEAEREACEGQGGEIRVSGILGHEICVQTLPDAGDACKEQSDCLGYCLVPDDKKRDVNPGEPMEGVCAKTDDPFGCFAMVDGGMASPMLCID